MKHTTPNVDTSAKKSVLKKIRTTNFLTKVTTLCLTLLAAFIFTGSFANNAEFEEGYGEQCAISVKVNSETICTGEKATLTAELVGKTECRDCDSYGVKNTNSCRSADPDYVLFLGNTHNDKKRYYKNVSLSWNIDNEDRAVLSGIVSDTKSGEKVKVYIKYYGKTSYQGAYKDNACHPANPKDWTFYTKMHGTISSTSGRRWSTKISRKGPAFQVGVGANETEQNSILGASGWFDTDNNYFNTGDVNFNLGKCHKPRTTSVDYLWSNGATTQSITVNPSETTAYYVKVRACDGCKVKAKSVVTVEELTVHAGEDQSICVGSTITLSADATADSYVWSNGATTQSIEVSPVVTTAYTVTATKGNCTASDEVIVNVNNFSIDPVEDIVLGNDMTTVTLPAIPADVVSWSVNGIVIFETTTGESPTVSPEETTTYTIEASKDGCSATSTITVIVEDCDLTVSAGEDQEICLGKEITLTASEADSYVWSTGETTQTITVAPAEITTYSVTATKGRCEATDEVTVTVEDFTIEAGADQTITEGATTTLPLIEGADTIEWTANGQVVYSGPADTAPEVSPTETTTYTVTAIKGECTATDTVTINILVCAATVDAGEDSTSCEGEEVTLTASGNVTKYVWSTGATTATITVAPVQTTTYMVTGTDANGCEATDMVQVTVTPSPEIDLGEDRTICITETTTLEAGAPIMAGQAYEVTDTQFCKFDDVEYVIWLRSTDKTIYLKNVDATWRILEDNTGIFAGTVIDPETNMLFTVNVLFSEYSNVAPDGSPKNNQCNGSVPNTTGWGYYSKLEGSIVSSDGTINADVLVRRGPAFQIGVDGNSAEVREGLFGGSGWFYSSDKNYSIGDVNIIIGKPIPNPDITCTFEWSTGETTPTIEVSPTVDTTYTVTITKNGCSTSDSVTITVDTNCETGNKDTASLEVKVYPNPARSGEDVTLNMVSTVSQSMEVVVFDMKGNSVNQSISQSILPGNNSITIDTKNLASGIYFAQMIDTNGGRNAKRFIIK